MYLFIVFSLTVQSAFGFQFTNIVEQKQSNREVPSFFPNIGLPKQSPQNHGDCDKLARLEKVLWEIISSLRQDISTNAQHTDPNRDFLTDPNEVANDKYGIYNLQRTLDNLIKSDQYYAEISKYGLNRNDRKDDRLDTILGPNFNLQYDLPSVKNSYCAEALLGLVKIVYQMYVNIMRHGTCQSSGSPNSYKTFPPVTSKPPYIGTLVDPEKFSATIVGNNIPNIYNLNRNPSISTTASPDMVIYQDGRVVAPFQPYNLLKPNENYQILKSQNPKYNMIYPNINNYMPIQNTSNTELPNVNYYGKSPQSQPTNVYNGVNDFSPDTFPFNNIPKPQTLKHSNILDMQHPKNFLNGIQRPDYQFKLMNPKQYPGPNNFLDKTINPGSTSLYNTLTPDVPLSPTNIFPFDSNAGYLNPTNSPLNGDRTHFEKKIQPGIIPDIKSNQIYADYFKVNPYDPSRVIPPIFSPNGIPKISSSTLRSNIVPNETPPSFYEWLPNPASNISIEMQTYNLYRPRDPLLNSNNIGSYTSPSQNKNTFTQLEIITFIRSAIKYVEVLIPLEKFDASTLSVLTLLKQILNQSNEYILREAYFTVLELYQKLINYIKTLSGYEEVIDHMDLSRVTNGNKLENGKYIVLTYLLKQPMLYNPSLYVKYKLPYQEYLVETQKVLINNPGLIMNPNDLYGKLLVRSDVVETSPDIKNYNKDDLINLTFKSGSLVNAKLIDGDIKPFLNNNKILQSTEDFSNRIKLANTNLQGINAYDPHVVSHQVNSILTTNFYADNGKPQMSALNTGPFLKTPLENFQVNKIEHDPATAANFGISLAGPSNVRNDIIKNEQNNSPYQDYVLSSGINSLNAPALQRLHKATSKATHLKDDDQINYQNLGGVYNIYEKKVSINQPHPMLMKTSSSYSNNNDDTNSKLFRVMQESIDSPHQLSNLRNANEDTSMETKAHEPSMIIPNGLLTLKHLKENKKPFNATVNEQQMGHNNVEYKHNFSIIHDYQELPSDGKYFKSLVMETKNGVETAHKYFGNENDNSSETEVQKSSAYSNEAHKDNGNKYMVYKTPMYSQYVQNIPIYSSMRPEKSRKPVAA